MRVALILCGQLRTFALTRCVVQRIKELYSCDVFMGVDSNNLLRNAANRSGDRPTQVKAISEAVDFVDPIESYVFDEDEFKSSLAHARVNPQVSIPLTRPDTASIEQLVTRDGSHWKIKKLFDDSMQVRPAYNMQPDEITILLRQYFLVDKCYEMLLRHMKTTGATYDVVMRLRFDQLLWGDDGKVWTFEGEYDGCEVDELGMPLYTPGNIDLFNTTYASSNIEMVNQDPNTISVIGCGQVMTYAYANDFFWTHGMDLTETMGAFYNNLPGIINQANKEHGCYAGATIEHCFLRYLVRNGVNIKRSNLDGLPVRELASTRGTARSESGRRVADAPASQDPIRAVTRARIRPDLRLLRYE